VNINPQNTVFVFGAKVIKRRIPAILRELSSFSSKIIFPDVLDIPNLENFYTVEKLKQYCPKGKPAKSLSQSLTQVKKMAGRNGTVVICGSLYLIGEILRQVKGIRTKSRIDDNIIESSKSKKT
jgi:folylpolyglutamate synthase/dihydropteroate synthase